MTAWDPEVRVGGMLHFMLPGERARAVPHAVRGRYASHALPLLFEELATAGAQHHRLVVCAVGGAAVGEDADLGRIGQRNAAFLRHALAARGMALAADDLGGTMPRSVDLDTKTGVVGVRAAAGRHVLWQRVEGG